MAQELTSYGELYPGRFIRAADIGKGKPVFTIDRVVADDLEGDRGAERKVIVILRETPQAWVMSKINGTCLKAMFGSDVLAWHGKRVCLFSTDQLMPMPTAKGDDRFCIRVYGSPDLERDLTVEFKVPKRKPIVMTLKGPTKKPAGVAQEPAPAEGAEHSEPLIGA
jgi:hypothetical protein